MQAEEIAESSMHAHRFSPEQADICFGLDFVRDVRAHSLANFIRFGDAYFNELISGFVVRWLLRNKVHFKIVAHELSITADILIVSFKEYLCTFSTLIAAAGREFDLK